MLSKKSKIEQRSKSRERRLWPDAASANLCRTRAKLGGRPLLIRRGPSHRHARPAPAALKNSVHLQEKPFSTPSVRCTRHEPCPGTVGPPPTADTTWLSPGDGGSGPSARFSSRPRHSARGMFDENRPNVSRNHFARHL